MAISDIPQSAYREKVYHDIVQILMEISADWDIGEISAETHLRDCVYESISLVYLIGDLQYRYNLQDQLGEKLRTTEIKITDLRVADLVALICSLLPMDSNSSERGEV